MNDNTIPVYVLTGFLGSGKTTLLNRVLEDAKTRGLKPAIVLNEVGDVNVEGQLIEKDIPMSELLGGCICCSSRGDLGLELMQLAQESKPDVIWIESTGIAQPLDIIDGVTEASLYAKLELRSVITLVDSRQLLDRMSIGTGKTFKLMNEQIRAADVLILNKADLVRQTDLERLQEALEDWNPHGRKFLTVRGEIDLSELYVNGEESVGSGRNDRERVETTSHHEHSHDHGSMHDHVNAVTYFFENDIDSVAFERFLKELPDNVYRAKGIVSFRDAASLFLFQYAYRESDFLRITPQKSVQRVAVFIGEGFSREDLIDGLKKLEA